MREDKIRAVSFLHISIIQPVFKVAVNMEALILMCYLCCRFPTSTSAAAATSDPATIPATTGVDSRCCWWQHCAGPGNLPTTDPEHGPATTAAATEPTTAPPSGSNNPVPPATPAAANTGTTGAASADVVPSGNDNSSYGNQPWSCCH